MNNIKKLSFLCCMVYFMSYMTRINYQAALPAIISDLKITKELASIAVTGSFVTYGIGQVISGIIGDKLKPEKLIFAGLLGTALINIIMFFAPNITFMNVIWCFNGFFQAMLWPPLVRILTENMPLDKYETSVLHVSWAAYLATVIIYLIVPLVLEISSWRVVFVLSGVLAIAFCSVWLVLTRDLKPKYDFSKVKETGEKISIGLLLSVGFIPILISILLQGMLRDGITTWMPSYISETFNIGESISILSTAVLPIFSIFGTALTTVISKKINNELLSSAVFFASAFVSNGIMILLFAKFAPLDIFCMAAVNVCMHGVNLMLISNVPRHFAKYGKVSTISGILNASTYVGSALATYVFAVVYDMFDNWKINVIFWSGLALAGFLLCLSCVKTWKKFREKE